MHKNFSYSKERVVFSIVFTAIFLCLSLIALFVSKYIAWPLGDFGLKIDLSIIFIFPIAFFLHYRYTLIALLIRFLLGPVIQLNIDATGYLGHFILLVANLIFIFSFFLFKKLFEKIIKNKNWFIILSLVLSIIVTTIVITTLNIFVFNWPYFYLYGIKMSYEEYLTKYFTVSLITFIPFNLANYLLSSILTFGIIVFLETYYKNHRRQKHHI
ncbi:MPN527 family putative ECF transporter permease subunit [Mycoplasma sp. 1012]